MVSTQNILLSAYVKARLLDEPDYSKTKPKKKGKLHVECASGLGR